MYLRYGDEPGSPQAPNQKYYVLAGIAVFGRSPHWLGLAYWYLPALLYLPLPVLAMAAVQDSVTVLGQTLNLAAENGQCVLHAPTGDETRRIVLKPAPPCFFLRHDPTRPQHFAYPAKKIDAALIVGGTAPNTEQRRVWQLAKDQLCGTELQGILLSRKQVRATRLVMKRGHACKEIGLDEKDFWTFAQEPADAPTMPAKKTKPTSPD